MMNKKQLALNSSFIIHHLSLPLQLQAQAVELLHVVGFYVLGRGAARADAAGDARAVEGELAGRAVEARAHAPVRVAAPRQRAVGGAGAPRHRTEALVVGLRDEPAQHVRAQVLAQESPLPPER